MPEQFERQPGIGFDDAGELADVGIGFVGQLHELGHGVGQGGQVGGGGAHSARYVPFTLQQNKQQGPMPQTTYPSCRCRWMARQLQCVGMLSR